ncbi:hypothetical protein MSAN_00477300 [Mycena sanguinolenta]|uniref:F-box domain-containing protein n=1 Tax=Mycena sanguinolenta TaxID=230812 RepID=A0A8H6Z522_9AGAR|nr:hypothetical protein MSAN_00477300 [Mycena sanguinolenta]
MALTRSATQNLVVCRLPNEMLGAIMEKARRPDLAALCQTSRLLRDIGTPILYRAIELSKDTQVEGFSCTITSSPSLSRLVQVFDMTQFGLNQESVHFIDVLDLAYFPNLATLTMTVRSPTPTLATLVARFVGRHSTITRLVLLQPGAPQGSDPDDIRDLNSLSGLGAFVSFILRQNILSVTLSYAPPDPDEIPLPRSDTTPNEIIVLDISESLTASIILEGIVDHLPHTRGLEIMRFKEPAQISPEETAEIGDYLSKLLFLSNWGLRCHTDCKNAKYERSGDEAILAAWSAACGSLSSITFHGRTWKRLEGSWHILEDESKVVEIL